jgi:phosphoribosylaminoimidazolecarboxamide formyltransferase/IMP cyclohydrolase
MPIRRALISVSDKTRIVDFAQALAKRDVALLSTGGTLKALAEAGVPVESVESYTGSPEVMDGRVKTLHPKVHGGLLAREDTDEKDLERIGARYIDLVVVNLYPFEQTLKKSGVEFAELIENIDIGGPSMLRSAAKNHSRVTVVCDPADYTSVLAEISEQGDTTPETRRRLAAKVFAHTAAYDAAISGWLSGVGEKDEFPRYLCLPMEKAYGLRYGENPHQSAAFYRERDALPGTLARAESLGSGAKELSFNNFVDVDAALEAVTELETPGAVVVKHTSPCGEATAALLAETFLECVIAPSFAPAALERLRQKSALRLLATGSWLPRDRKALALKRIGGGYVIQSRDATGPGEVRAGKVVTERTPSDSELAALEFAWSVVKHVKSNAIVLARSDGPSSLVTSGIGGGQTARVLAVEIACKNAAERAKGSVLASDAFFPFPDGVEAAARAGVSAVVQPGGSKKDADVIAAANRLGLSMVFTGVRHFRH